MGGIDDWQRDRLDDYLAGRGFSRRGREYRRLRGEFHQIFHVQVSNTVGITEFQLFAAVSSMEFLRAFGRPPGKPRTFEDWHWSEISEVLVASSTGVIARRWVDEQLPEIERMSDLGELIKHSQLSGTRDQGWRDRSLQGKVLRAFGDPAERDRFLRDEELRIGDQPMKLATPFTPRQMSRPRLEQRLRKAASPRWQDRWTAAVDLGRWRSSPEVIAALELLAEDVNAHVRIRAVGALAKHGQRQILPKALALLDDLDGQAATSLTWAVTELSSTPEERQAACAALARLRTRATGPDLQGILAYERRLGCAAAPSS